MTAKHENICKRCRKPEQEKVAPVHINNVLIGDYTYTGCDICGYLLPLKEYNKVMAKAREMNVFDEVKEDE